MRVLSSHEDETGQRCVDILELASANFGYSECRRDPEDPHGWRRLGPITDGFRSEAEARTAAVIVVNWLEDTP